MAALACGLQAELKIVEEQMKKEIRFKTSKMDDLIDLPLNKLEKHLYPAIVLAVCSIKGQINNKNIPLATIFQYIFLAHRIHKMVIDEDMEEHARQYPVLVGDFMFGQTLLKLCEEDMLCYIGDFVKAIETINEGILLRWRLKNKNLSLKDYRLILGKEKAALTALAGKLGGVLAGFEGACLKKLEEFGYSIGMAWAAWEEPQCSTLLNEYLARTKAIIVELKEYMPVRTIQELFQFFYQEISPNAVYAGIEAGS